jgi:hypothetical protein
MAKKDQDAAREAGQQAAKNAEVSVEGCPFPPGDEQRVAWLEGYMEVLDNVPDPETERRAIREELKGAKR